MADAPDASGPVAVTVPAWPIAGVTADQPAGVATANAFTQDSSADNTGTASWFRALK